MSTKALNADQHAPLHQLYPGDCCLCKAEERIKELESKLSVAEELAKYWKERTENAWKREDEDGMNLFNLVSEKKELKKQLQDSNPKDIINLFITTYLIPAYDQHHVSAKLRSEFNVVVSEAEKNMVEMGDLK